MLIKNNYGLTLIELLVTLSILGIALSLSVPSLLSLINKNQKSSIRDELMSALSLARSSAITTGDWASICSSDATLSQCSSLESNWELGWIVFQDSNRNGTIDNSEKIISVKSKIPNNLTIQTSINRITFDSRGVADGYKSTFLMCNNGANNSTPSGIYVSNFGRFREITSEDEATDCDE